MDAKIETKVISGKLFKNGVFQDKDFRVENDVITHYFIGAFTIGTNNEMYVECRYKFEHNEWTEQLPKYAIAIGFDTSDTEDIEELFFMESIIDVNEFLKEMKPLIEITNKVN